MNTDLPIRDIHLPENVSWWPIAPGWWLLLLMTVFITLLIYQRHRKQNKTNPVSINTINPASRQIIIDDALDLLDEISKFSDDKLVIKEISVLLRRTAMSLDGDNEIVSSTGRKWLHLLDDMAETTEFTQGVGQVLMQQPYQKETNYQKDELITLIQKWLTLQNKHPISTETYLTSTNKAVSKKSKEKHV